MPDVLSMALKKVSSNKEMKAEDKEALSNLLKAAISKMKAQPSDKAAPAKSPEKADDKGEELSTDKATELLEEASAKLESQDEQLKTLKEKNSKLEEDIKTINKKEQNSLVDSLIKKEVLMGITEEAKKNEKVEIYRKLGSEDLRKLSKDLEGKKRVEAKKETLKGSEPADKKEVDENLEKKKELMRQAGIQEDTIKELYEEEDE